MTASRPDLPAYRKQKSKGRADRAFVVIDGNRHYLGRHGSEESRRRYDQLIAEWLSGGRRLPVAREAVTVAVLVDRYWQHVKGYYVHADGTPTWEQANIQQAVRVLSQLYADTPAGDFGPRQLKAVRQAMIDRGWSRPWINKSVDRIRRAFRWAGENELVAPGVYQALQTVASLKVGRTDAPEPKPIGPVSPERVEATLPYLTPTLAAMVRTQQLTGMRPGEVCKLTAGMIDVKGEVWTATFAEHKTSYRGRTRTVFLGPKAQDVLRPYMKTDPQAPLFSPQQSERERRQHLHEQRKTPHSCGNLPGTNRVSNPRRPPRDRYTTDTYSRAIQQACDAACPPPAHLARQRIPAEGRKAERRETRAEWRTRLKQAGLLAELAAWQAEQRWAPNQLRHAYATQVRKEYGLEAAQGLLGHARADVTQVYAERDADRARQVAREVG